MNARLTSLLFRCCISFCCVSVCFSTRSFISNGHCENSPEGFSSNRVGVASWIWIDEGIPTESAPKGTRWFRKTFSVRKPTKVVLDITADDGYQVFLNGDQIGSGANSRHVDRHDLSSRIRPGKNVLAVSVVNHGGPAGLLARCLVFTPGHAQAAICTDDSWRVSGNEAALWSSLDFDHSQWTTAKPLGSYGISPWGALKWPAESSAERFHIPDGFRVQEFAAHTATGPVVRIAFDAQGRMLACRDGGPILLLEDADNNGNAESISVYADQVRYCQGLAVDGENLYAVALRGNEEGLFRLCDTNGDDQIDCVEPLDVVIRHQGSDEHGTHQVVLGPDGWLYWAVGNFAYPTGNIRDDSPANRCYEGNLLEPRYEAVNGHAAGVKVPGGSIYRWNPRMPTVQWERVASGLRNNYDMAFNRAGDLFAVDSDMESDQGTPWYRPVRGYHLVPAAEFGWRSGSAKWPSYFLDSLPSAIDFGRGSPTGVAFYQHDMFPEDYHDVLFVGDWSQGTIFQVHFRRVGATWRGTTKIFMTGKPLNVTDVKVGPDGAVYFSCGGRGSEGGIFRVIWDGTPRPQKAKLELPNDIASALRQPQPNSAWARAEILQRQARTRSTWESSLIQVTLQSRFGTEIRRRALNLLHQHGPAPTADLLNTLAEDSDCELRSQAIRLMANKQDNSCKSAVVRALNDPAAHVRREACETITRTALVTPINGTVPTQLLHLLADDDRWVRFAARRALQNMPAELWQDQVLVISNPTAAANGFLAILNTKPDKVLFERMLRRQIALAAARSTGDDALVDLIRTIGLSVLAADQLAPETQQRLRALLLELFPSPDWRINREVARLLAYFQEPQAVPKLMDRLAVEMEPVEQVHLVVCSRYLTRGWTHEHRRQLLTWLERHHQDSSTGYTAPGYAYLDNLVRHVVEQLDSAEIEYYLQSVDWPCVAQAVVTSLDTNALPDYAHELIELDHQLRTELRHLETNLEITGKPSVKLVTDLRHAIVASLAKSQAGIGDLYLGQLFDNDPDYRADILTGFADRADPAHWEYLVRGLAFSNGKGLLECLQALLAIDRQPIDSNTIRDAIIAGLKLHEGSRPLAASLLTHWVESPVAESNDPAAMGKWQRWFTEKFPNSPPPELPNSQTALRWKYDQLLQFLTSERGRNGSSGHGESVFKKAKCAACHRFGQRGESIGPELSTVRQRFQNKEILQAIIFPSQIISDQYRSYVVTTNDGRIHLGMVTPLDTKTVTLIDSQGQKLILPRSKIESQALSAESIMPEGLLDSLSLSEIADLFAFLQKSPSSEQNHK